MMFTVRLERNVVEHHDFVISADLMKNSRQMIGRIIMIPLAIFLPCTRDAGRRFDQSLARRIIADPPDETEDE